MVDASIEALARGANERLAAVLGVDPDELAVQQRIDSTRPTWSDELLTNWPEELPRPSHPASWRPSVRAEQRWAMVETYTRYLSEHAGAKTPLMVEAVYYSDWVRRRYVIEDGPGEVVMQGLLSDRSINRKLSELVQTPDTWENPSGIDITRRFEQQYLGLAPLEPEDDEDDDPESDLRIVENGLYDRGAAGMYSSDGGDIPTAALSNIFKMEPTAFRQLIDHYSEDSDGHVLPKWTLLRSDHFVFPVMPIEGDPDNVIVGRVYELTRDGIEIMEGLLAVYEAGMRHGEKK